VANLSAIRSVGSSLAEYLDRAYRSTAFPGNLRPECEFSVVSSSQIQSHVEPTGSAVQVLLYLYRANIDTHLRNSGRAAAPDMRPVPLSVNLHYLFSFWSLSAASEHLALAWTLRQLHAAPLLDSSVLDPDANWGADEMVQLIPAELSNEDMMRIWDALRPDYHLSVAYIARVVRIDPDAFVEPRPVIATRLNLAVPGAS
jgi:hypothetical protein